jgi:hypothetical protein
MSRRGGRGGGSGNHSKSSVVSKELLKRSASEAGLDDRHLKILTDITRPPLFPDFLWHSNGKYWNEGEISIDNQHAHQQASTSTEPSTTKLPSSAVCMMNKQRELTMRMQSGPHYIRPPDVMDIVRYSDRKGANEPSLPDAFVLASTSRTNRKLATDTRYFPPELLSRRKHVIKPQQPQPLDGIKRLSRARKSALIPNFDAAVLNLEELATQESSSRNRPRSNTNTSVGKNAASAEAASADGNDNYEDDDDNIAAAPEDEEEGEDYTTNYYKSDDDDSNDGRDGEPTY